MRLRRQRKEQQLLTDAARKHQKDFQEVLDSKQWSPDGLKLAFFASVHHSNLLALKALLQKEIRANITCKDGNHIVYCAVQAGDPQVVDLLLRSQFGNHMGPGKDGIYPIELAIKENKYYIAALLLNHISNIHTQLLEISIFNHNIRITRLLLQNGGNIQYALIYALKAGYAPMIHMLLDMGAKLDQSADAEQSEVSNLIPINHILFGKVPLNSIHAFLSHRSTNIDTLHRFEGEGEAIISAIYQGDYSKYREFAVTMLHGGTTIQWEIFWTITRHSKKHPDKSKMIGVTRFFRLCEYFCNTDDIKTIYELQINDAVKSIPESIIGSNVKTQTQNVKQIKRASQHITQNVECIRYFMHLDMPDPKLSLSKTIHGLVPMDYLTSICKQFTIIALVSRTFLFNIHPSIGTMILSEIAKEDAFEAQIPTINEVIDRHNSIAEILTDLKALILPEYWEENPDNFNRSLSNITEIRRMYS